MSFTKIFHEYPLFWVFFVLVSLLALLGSSYLLHSPQTDSRGGRHKRMVVGFRERKQAGEMDDAASVQTEEPGRIRRETRSVTKTLKGQKAVADDRQRPSQESDQREQAANVHEDIGAPDGGQTLRLKQRAKKAVDHMEQSRAAQSVTMAPRYVSDKTDVKQSSAAEGKKKEGMVLFVDGINEVLGMDHALCGLATISFEGENRSTAHVLREKNSDSFSHRDFMRYFTGKCMVPEPTQRLEQLRRQWSLAADQQLRVCMTIEAEARIRELLLREGYKPDSRLEVVVRATGGREIFELVRVRPLDSSETAKRTS